MCYVIDIDNLILNVSRVKRIESFKFSDLMKCRIRLEDKITNVYFSVTKDSLYRNLSSYNGLLSYQNGVIYINNIPKSFITNSNETIPKEIKRKYFSTLKTIDFSI